MLNIAGTSRRACFPNTERLSSSKLTCFVLLYFVFCGAPAFSQATGVLSERDIFLESGPFGSAPEQLRDFVERLNASPRPQGDETEDDGYEPQTDYLVRSTSFHFRADGKIRILTWDLLQVLTRDAATPASQVIAQWSPWRTARPKLQARVLNTDGKVIESDGANAFEQSANDGSNSVHTDRRQLTLLLSGVEKGSIVESTVEEVVSPIFADAYVRRVALTDLSPSRVHSVKVTADPGVQPTIEIVGSPLTPIRTSASDAPFETIFEITDPNGFFQEFESHTGPDRASYPMLVLGRGGDWTELGDEYAKSVEKSIADGAKIVQQIAASAGDDVRNGSTDEKLQWALKTQRQLVRYMGVEFGEHSIFPVSPDQVVQRRFGDCKDQACLFVSLLRELGVNSHVALINTGSGIDVRPDLPALDLFNHAIAYIDDLDQWVDLTAESYPVKLLPPSDRGRRTLICRPIGSELKTTPTYRSKVNRELSVDRYRINFSGGGHLESVLRSWGDAGVELRSGYHDQPAAALVKLWSDYFLSTIVDDEVASMRVADISEDEYAVAVQSGSMQLLDRIEFTSDATWDRRELLEYVPSALVPYIDSETGEVAESRPRELPVFIRDGLQYTTGVDIEYPAAMVAGPLPQNWSRRFGLLRLTATYRRGATDEIADPLLECDEWRQIKKDANIYPAEKLAAHDASIQVRFQLEVEPGVMSAADTNACRAFLASLNADDSRLTGKVPLTWESLRQMVLARTEDAFSSLVSDGLKYRALEEPYIGVLTELSALGLGMYARTEAAEFRDFPPDQSYVRNWLPQIKVISRRPDGFLTPESDIVGLRRLLATSDFLHSDPIIQLNAILAEENSLRTSDPQKLAVAWDLIRQLVEGGYLDYIDDGLKGSIYAVMVRSGLQLKKDEELKRLIRLLRLGPLDNVMLAMLDGKGFPKNVAADLAAAPMLGRVAWELAVTAERFPMVRTLQSELKKIELSAPLEVTSDEGVVVSEEASDPVAVARRALIAWLSHDVATAEELFLPSENAASHIGAPLFGPLKVNNWFLRLRNARTTSLIQTVVGLTPAEVRNIGASGRLVTFKSPFADPVTAEPSEYSMLMLRVGDSWRVLTEPLEIGAYLVDLSNEGKDDDAAKLLDHLAPSQSGFFSFMTLELPSPSFRLWMRFRSDEWYRVPLVARAIVAEASGRMGELEMLETWILDEGLDLTPSQLAQLEEIREAVWWRAGAFKNLYDGFLAEVTNKPTEESIDYLIDCLFTDRFDRWSLADENGWKEPLADYFATSGSSFVMQADYQLLLGNNEEAFRFLEQAVRNRHDFSAANALLWRSLLLDVPVEELAERLAIVEAMVDEQITEQEMDLYFLQTIVCARAQCGHSLSAASGLQILAMRDYYEETDIDLARGFVLESLGMTEGALQMYESSHAEQSSGQRRRIAEIGMRRLAE